MSTTSRASAAIVLGRRILSGNHPLIDRKAWISDTQDVLSADDLLSSQRVILDDLFQRIKDLPETAVA